MSDDHEKLSQQFATAITTALMSVVPAPADALRAVGDRHGFDLTIEEQDEEDRRLCRLRVSAVRRARPFTFTVTLGASDAPSR